MAGRLKMTSAQIEEQIKALQLKLAKAKIKESTTRFSTEIRKRLKQVMENHNVELTEAEFNVIVNPCEIVEKMYFQKIKGE